MQLVIDIPDDHKRVIDNLVIDGKGYLLPNEVEDTLAKAVKSGTPLPKNHGRLIDGDRVVTGQIYDDEYEEYTKYAHSSHLVAINSSVS